MERVGQVRDTPTAPPVSHTHRGVRGRRFAEDGTQMAFRQHLRHWGEGERAGYVVPSVPARGGAAAGEEQKPPAAATAAGSAAPSSFWLERGDLLYVPNGMVHRAEVRLVLAQSPQSVGAAQRLQRSVCVCVCVCV